LTAAKISLLDLTVDQVEKLELELGKPIDEWIALPSRAAVFRRVYTVATGADAATVGAMTMRQLTDAVSMDDDEPEDAETGNP
jgi:hypothetical protein